MGGTGNNVGSGLTAGLGLRLPPQTDIGTPDNPLSTWLRAWLTDPERQRMDQRRLEAIQAMASGMTLTPNQWVALKSGTPTGEFLYGPGQPSRSGITPPPPPVPPPVSIANPSMDVAGNLPPLTGVLATQARQNKGK